VVRREIGKAAEWE